MDDLGVTAKELTLQIKGWASQDPEHRQALDVRTIQNAMDGSCGLETFITLSGFFGWDFIEQILTPAVGADPLSAREAELERYQAEAAAIFARVQRERAARSAPARLADQSHLVALQESRGGRTGAPEAVE